MTSVEVRVDATVRLPGGRDGVRLVVRDDGAREEPDDEGAPVIWEAER